MLWALKNIVEHRIASDFGRWDVRLFGIAVAIGCFFLVPYVPSIIGNLIWGTALFSQIVIPLTRGWRTLRNE